MKKAIIIAILMIIALGQLASQDTASVNIDPEKKTEITRLLKAMGNFGIAEQIKQQVKTNFLNMVPNATSEYMDTLLLKYETMEFIDLLVPVYDSYFSLEEIKELVKFFESPTGVKYQQVIMSIAPEVFSKEDLWTEKMRKEIIEIMKKDELIQFAK